ncbi:MAG: HAMP domain-containing sensor histidine kinase [Alphaproteobacteria bacterium]|nr:HAMP domain-containing sensor histidine kinase [Alphaproteobacteria bacterium]
MENLTSKDEAARAIAEAIPEPILLVGADCSILTANDRFAVAFGFSSTELVPKKLTDMFTESVSVLQEAVRDWLGTSEPLPRMLHRHGADDSSSAIRVEGWRTVYNKRAAVIVRFFIDHSSVDRFIELSSLVDNLNRECAARARIEKELRQLLGQLNATNNMRDLIMAQMSHDLRTPLNAVLGMSEFMLTEPFGPIEAHYHEYIGDIRHSGEVLLELMNSVLEFTDDTDFMERAKDLLVDLSACLESCHRVVAPMAARRGISLLVPMNVRAPHIRAEKTMVKQILMNLIGNATKHINSGGHIKVEVDWGRGKDMNVSVVDDGPGIESDKLDSLLNASMRDPYSTNKVGFGMGLFLTKRSAEAIGIQVKIDSILGKGTTATMTIPSTMLDYSRL